MKIFFSFIILSVLFPIVYGYDLRTSWVHAEITQGGCFAFLALPHYYRTHEDQRGVKLLRKHRLCKAFQIITEDIDWSQVQGIVQEEGSSSEKLHLIQEKDGLQLERIYDFGGETFLAHVTFRLINHKDTPYSGDFKIEIGAFSERKKPAFWSAQSVEPVESFVMTSKKLRRETLPFQNTPSLKEFWTDESPPLWAGVGTQFFSFVLLPKDPKLWKSSLRREPFNLKRTQDAEVDQTLYSHFLTQHVTLNPDQIFEASFDVYAGPKKYDALKTHSLTKLIDFGLFEVVAYPLFRALKALYNHVIANWGWCIVLLTLLLKILFIPLQMKSFISQQAMKNIQPHLNEIKEKYRNDKVRLQQETMAYLRAKGVSPFSGCLPILPQIPIFFGLNAVFRHTFELRHAPFIGWIQDLSSPDPYILLPIIYAFLMYLQQKINPIPMSDPQQEKIMKLLPILFSFFMLSLPSGLTLYFIVQSFAGLFERLLIQKVVRSSLLTPNR